MIVGDSSVGKSSLLGKIIDSKFDMNTTPTVGVDFVHLIFCVNVLLVVEKCYAYRI